MRHHFIEAMRARAPGINGARVFDELAIAIGEGHMGREWKICPLPGHRECWRFVAGGRVLYCVWDPRFLCPVTVLPPGWKVRRRRRGKMKKLRDVTHAGQPTA